MQCFVSVPAPFSLAFILFLGLKHQHSSNLPPALFFREHSPQRVSYAAYCPVYEYSHWKDSPSSSPSVPLSAHKFSSRFLSMVSAYDVFSGLEFPKTQDFPFIFGWEQCLKKKIVVLLRISFVCLPHHIACRILVPWSGMNPCPPTVKVQSLNHWTAREVSRGTSLNSTIPFLSLTILLPVWVAHCCCYCCCCFAYGVNFHGKEFPKPEEETLLFCHRVHNTEW